MENLVLAQKMLGTVKQTLIDGLTIASGSKSSATYYHNRDEQIVAIRKEINKMYNISKELPLLIACQKGVTGRFISEVLLNEFKNTSKGGACNIINPIDWYDNGLSDKAILIALNSLNVDNGIPYVFRLFQELKVNKINNERSRKFILGFIWGQKNLEFYVLKYRNKIAKILKHVYGERKISILLSIGSKLHLNSDNQMILTPKEYNILNNLILKYYSGDSVKAVKLLFFIFKKNQNVEMYNDVNEFPLIGEYQKARVDITNIKNIPEEVLIGLISNVNHPQHQTMWSNSAQRETTKALIRKNVEVTSINQQVRQTKSNIKLGVEKNVSLEKATDFLALYKTGYENGFTLELNSAIDKLAEKRKINNFYYENVGIIQDDSISMTGNKIESKNTPRAIANFTAKVLAKSTISHVTVKTNDIFTDLGSSFIQLLKKNETSNIQYDAIFIITDGYENMYDGLLNEIISIWKNETGIDIPIFQISPITSAEMGSNVRKIGSSVITMAINNPIAIQPQISARLLEIDTKRWLKNQLLMLEESNLSRINKINANN